MKKFIFVIVIFSMLFTGILFEQRNIYASLSAGEADFTFGRSFNNGDVLTAPNDIAIATNGNIYVTDLDDQIYIFDNDGNYINQFGFTGNSTTNASVDLPNGIALDSVGNVYVAESLNNRIHKFSASGAHITTWPVRRGGSLSGVSMQAMDIAIDSDDNVYVTANASESFYGMYFSSVTNHSVIQKFDSAGNFVSEFYAGNSGFSRNYYFQGITIGSDGNLYVINRDGNKLHVLDRSLNLLRTHGIDNYPQGIAIAADGTIYISYNNDHKVRVYTIDANQTLSLTRYWGSSGTLNTQFNSPKGINFDSNGNLYVADYGGGRIMRFTGYSQNNSPQNVYVDATPPVVEGVKHGGGYATAVHPTFNEGTATLSKDGGTAKPFESGEKITDDGVYVLTVIDYFYNVTTIEFMIDKVAPVLTGVVDKGIYTTGVTVKFNEGKATLTRNTYSYSEIDSGAKILDDGDYSIKVSDVAGNTEEASFLIDQTAPRIEGVEAGVLYKTSQVVTFNEGIATLFKDDKEMGEFESGTQLSEDGKYKLKVTDNAGNVSEISFQIDRKIYVTGVKLAYEQLNMQVYDVFSMVAIVSPEKPTNPNVIWTSSNPLLTKVDSWGRITALAPGVTTITATTIDGNYKAYATISTEWTTYARAVDASKVGIIRYSKGDRQSRVTANLMLAKESRNNSTITWKSNRPDIISDTGIVRRPTKAKGNKHVLLTAFVKIGNVQYKREFQLYVIAE